MSCLLINMLLDLFKYFMGKFFLAKKDTTRQFEWCGQEVNHLHEQVSSRLRESMRIAKRARPPKVNVERYVKAQCYEEIRSLVRVLLEGQRWRFVSFEEFLNVLESSSRILLEKMNKPCCVVVDSVKKSSFWVLMLVLHLIKQNKKQKSVFDNNIDNLSLIALYERPQQYAVHRMKKLVSDCVMVFIDDASYSGEQLHEIIQSTTDCWCLAWPSQNQLPGIEIIIPYMSRQAQSLMTTIPSINMNAPKLIDNIFANQNLESILKLDYFLPWTKRKYVTEYWSFFFRFLSLRTFQTLTFFEHKIPDALSLPDYWLLAGPCMVPDITHAFRVRPDKVQALSRLLLSEIDRDIGRSGAALEDREKEKSEMFFGEVFDRVELLMSSEKFRKKFMQRIIFKKAEPQKIKWPSFSPLVDPSGCDESYRKLLKQMRNSPNDYLRHVSMQHTFFSKHLRKITPSCYLAPYKQIVLIDR